MTEFRATLSVAKKFLEDQVLFWPLFILLDIFYRDFMCEIITGAPLELAAVDALVEPIINGFWFYLLHSTWKRFRINLNIL